MWNFVLLVVASLFLILLAAELFTNGLEHLGERLAISEGVTGSLFAAVGTALPETVIPLIAVFTGSTTPAIGEEIGVGAILGAPLMLSTLTLSLLGLAALRRDRGHVLHPEQGGLARDLNTFICAFVLAAAAMFVPAEHHGVRQLISAVLVGLYVFYVWGTMRASRTLVKAGHNTTATSRLALSVLGLPRVLPVICVQCVAAVGLLLYGARVFIQGIEGVAAQLGASPLLLSLLLVPLATELPEKINSIRWVRRERDTLAFGNVTGAMVFQGTLLPAVGILLTPWSPRPEVLAGVVTTLVGALWLKTIARQDGVSGRLLLLNGLPYLIYLVVQITR